MDWTDEERAAVERRYALIEARHGGRIDAAGRALLLERLLELQRQAATLRAVSLTAAEEPWPPFAARPAPEWP